jgi:hypothetical protein
MKEPELSVLYNPIPVVPYLQCTEDNLTIKGAFISFQFVTPEVPKCQLMTWSYYVVLLYKVHGWWEATVVEILSHRKHEHFTGKLNSCQYYRLYIPSSSACGGQPSLVRPMFACPRRLHTKMQDRV